MADGPSITPASFTQAYRAYAPEQGNDALLSVQKASEVQHQTTASNTGLFPADTIAISPEAAKLYAEQAKKRRSILRREALKESRDLTSATANEEILVEPVTGQGDPQDRE